MKLIFFILCSLTVAVSAVDLQSDSTWPSTLDFKESGRVGSISLDVKEVASSRKITRNWETSYGSYDRDFLQGKTLAIDVTSLSPTPPTGLIVEVVWFSQELATKRLEIYTRKGQPLVFGGRMAKLTSELPPLESNVTNYAALGQRYVDGSKLAGWVVFVREPGGKVFRHRSSNPALEALTRDTAMTPLLTTFEKWRAANK